MDGMKCERCGGGTLRIMEYTTEGGDTDRFVCLDIVNCERRELEQENARLRAIVEPLERMVRTGGVVEIQLRGDGEIWVNFDNSASLGVATTLAEALAAAEKALEEPKQ